MIFYNDTGRNINIHPGTAIHGIACDMDVIKPREKRKFKAPQGVLPLVKLWDHGESGLTILVSAALGEVDERE
jgi:hypothetical protein